MAGPAPRPTAPRPTAPRPTGRAAARRAAPGHPSFLRMAGRAVLRRCPRCGGHGAWFTGWFARQDRCRTCAYRYERQDGFMLGAVTMNTIVTFGLFAGVLLAGSIAMYPEIRVWPLIAAGLVVAVAVPVAFYPLSYTLWAAVDLRMRPLEPAEEADAVTALAADGGSGRAAT